MIVIADNMKCKCPDEGTPGNVDMFFQYCSKCGKVMRSLEDGQ